MRGSRPAHPRFASIGRTGSCGHYLVSVDQLASSADLLSFCCYAVVRTLKAELWMETPARCAPVQADLRSSFRVSMRDYGRRLVSVLKEVRRRKLLSVCATGQPEWVSRSYGRVSEGSISLVTWILQLVCRPILLAGRKKRSGRKMSEETVIEIKPSSHRNFL